MTDTTRIEAARSQAELRAAYARAMSKQVQAGPQDLAGLRARFRQRSRELERGFGSKIEGRATWILACLESSLPDELLEAELLRLSADDPKLDLARLRQVLGAREAWREARTDPLVPPVVLHVLERRLGVPPRVSAMAQDVAEPQAVAQHIETTYPEIHGLDPAMFRRIAGLPSATGGRSGNTAAVVPEKTSGRRSFWLVVFSIWLVAKLLGLAVNDVDDTPNEEVHQGLEHLRALTEPDHGSDYDRIVRRLLEVRELETELRAASTEAQVHRSISLVRLQRLRERIATIRFSVKELVFAKAQMLTNPDFPGLDDLAELSTACQRAAHRLDRQRLQMFLDGAGGAARGGERER